MRKEHAEIGLSLSVVLVLFLSTKTSVLFVAFLSVLCVKFRRGQPATYWPWLTFRRVSKDRRRILLGRLPENPADGSFWSPPRKKMTALFHEDTIQLREPSLLPWKLYARTSCARF